MKAYIGMFICLCAIYMIEGLYALIVCIGGILAALSLYFITIKLLRK